MIDRKLTIFRTAAALRNFTETAAALGMTQPNVTHQLARLEVSSECGCSSATDGGSS